MKFGAEFHEKEMPAVDSNRPAVFLNLALNRANPQSKPNQIALPEASFRHGQFSVMSSPGIAADQCPEVIVHCLIETIRERIHCSSPSANFSQMKCGITFRGYRVKALVGDSVSPIDQLLKEFASTFVSHVQGIHQCPKIDAQSIEIRANGAGMWIAFAKTSIPDKFHSQESLEWRRNNPDNVIDTFRMKIPTESLKV